MGIPSIGATEGTCPPWPLGVGGWGTAIGVPANAFTLYIYFTNGNKLVKADF